MNKICPLVESIHEVASECIKQAHAWADDSIFVYPLLLSLVAALIFWMAFSFLPEKKRSNRLRPVLELDMLHIYQELFAIFDQIMAHQPRTPSFFQKSIRGGLLTRDNLSLGLQNKCLNSSYLFDSLIKKILMPIGKNIFDRSKKIDELISKVFSFSQYVSPEEILLLEEIREELKRYDFDENIINKSEVSTFGGQTGYPAIPALIYRINNFSDLYLLFQRLQEMVLIRNKFTNRSCCLARIQSLYDSGRYAKAKKEIKKSKSLLCNDAVLLDNYLASCEYYLGNKIKCAEIIDSTYKKRPYGGALVSSRGTLEPLLKDDDILAIIKLYHSDDEVNMLMDTIKKESDILNQFIMRNMKLSQYYSGKDSRLKPIVT